MTEFGLRPQYQPETTPADEEEKELYAPPAPCPNFQYCPPYDDCLSNNPRQQRIDQITRQIAELNEAVTQLAQPQPQPKPIERNLSVESAGFNDAHDQKVVIADLKEQETSRLQQAELAKKRQALKEQYLQSRRQLEKIQTRTREIERRYQELTSPQCVDPSKPVDLESDEVGVIPAKGAVASMEHRVVTSEHAVEINGASGAEGSKSNLVYPVTVTQPQTKSPAPEQRYSRIKRFFRIK